MSFSVGLVYVFHIDQKRTERFTSAFDSPELIVA